MTSERSIQDSRWHRPNLDMTVVALYLIVLVAAEVSLTVYYLLSNRCPPPCEHYVPIDLIFIASLFLFFDLPASLLATMILTKKKKAILASIIFLGFWTVPLLFLPFVSLYSKPVLSSLPVILGFAATLMANGVMFVLLVGGRKQVQWKSKSHLSQNNSTD